MDSNSGSGFHQAHYFRQGHHQHQHHHHHEHSHGDREHHLHGHTHHHHGHHHYRMDPSIWQHLPDPILNRILVRLPLGVLLNLRAVCKLWNSKIVSSAMAELRAGLFPHRPGFIRVSAHHSDAGHLQLDFLDRRFQWRKICLGVPPGSIDIEAAHAHLLCLSMTFNSLDRVVFKQFLMCNPVTAACKYLPPTLFTAYPIIVGMTLCRSSGHYFLVFGGNFRISASEHVASRTAEMYVSAIRSWRELPDMPPHITPVLTSVACQGRIFWLAWDDHDHLGLLCFDPQQMMWIFIQTPSEVECHVPWGLMERHGVLFKVGKVSNDANSKAYVWYLEGDAWQVSCEVPADSERHCSACVRHCVGHDSAFCADNSCGTGGLVYKFEKEHHVSLYKTPVCPDEDEAAAAVLSQHFAKQTLCTPISATGSPAGTLSASTRPISATQEETQVNRLGDLNSIHKPDEEVEGGIASSSSCSSSSYDSYSDSVSSTDEEAEVLEPDCPSTTPSSSSSSRTRVKQLCACTPDMVARFGHLYVFEPCLGKV